MVILGSCQTVALEYAPEAPAHVHLNENELVQHITELCVSKYRKEVQRQGESILLPYFASLQQVALSFGHAINGRTDLRLMVLSNFELRNVPRLLKQLCESACLGSFQCNRCDQPFSRPSDDTSHCTATHDVRGFD